MNISARIDAVKVDYLKQHFEFKTNQDLLYHLITKEFHRAVTRDKMRKYSKKPRIKTLEKIREEKEKTRQYNLEKNYLKALAKCKNKGVGK